MIESVNEKAFSEFCQKLASDRNEQLAAAQGNRLPWPSKQLTRMADAGVYRWFVPVERCNALSQNKSTGQTSFAHLQIRQHQIMNAPSLSLIHI